MVETWNSKCLTFHLYTHPLRCDVELRRIACSHQCYDISGGSDIDRAIDLNSSTRQTKLGNTYASYSITYRAAVVLFFVYSSSHHTALTFFTTEFSSSSSPPAQYFSSNPTLPRFCLSLPSSLSSSPVQLPVPLESHPIRVIQQSN